MKTLIIDPGHGGSDKGANKFGYYEKDITLIIAKRVRELLKEYSPDMTRISDVSLNPNPRTSKIKDKYKYCLSIHLNAFNGLAGGIETIHAINSSKGKELATSIANELQNKINLPIRRVFSRKNDKTGKNFYYMHRNTGYTTTVIVEGLFLDNEEDIKELNIEKISQAIANGFKHLMRNEVPSKEEIKVLTYHRLLKQGSRGADVTELQKALTNLGYNTNGIDSIFGRGTRTAVEHFQIANKLIVDGLVGRNTIKELNEALKKK